MRTKARWQRAEPLRVKSCVRALDCPVENTAADVRRRMASAGRGRENEGAIIVRREGRFVGGEVVAERWHEVNLANPSIRLCLHDSDPTGGQIEVTPAKSQSLANPKTSEDEGRDQRPP